MKSTKPIFKILAVLVLILLAGALFFSFGSKVNILGSSKEVKMIREGDRIPVNKFQSLSGESLTLSKKITLVHFWATWCGPCAEELPSFYKLLAGSSSQIQIFAISQDDSEAEVRAFMKPLKELSQLENFKIISDFHHELGSRFKVLALPETYIVDQQGVVLRKVVGSMDWSSDEVQKYFQENLIK